MNHPCQHCILLLPVFLELWLSSRTEKELDVEIPALLGGAGRHLFLESGSTKSLWGDGKVSFPSEEETLLDLSTGLICCCFSFPGLDFFVASQAVLLA